MSQSKAQYIADLVRQIRDFPLCGPSDDSDEQAAVCIGYRSLLVQLQRLTAPLLPDNQRHRLEEIQVDARDIYTVYDAQAEIATLLWDIENALANSNEDRLKVGTAFRLIEPEIIETIAAATSSELNTDTLVTLCKEINSTFSHGNLISTVLTLRAILNHIPPVFGQKKFECVVAQAGRSEKDLYKHLEDGLRKLADIFTHAPMSGTAVTLSVSQIEPYRPPLEHLLKMVAEQLTRSHKELESS